MKLRSGFVSNSSSSSFIVAIAKVVDPVKFEAFKSTVDMRAVDGVELVSLEDIRSNKNYDVKISRQKESEVIEVESFQTSVYMSAEDYKKAEDKKDVVAKAISSLTGAHNTDILVWNFTGNEDDSPFVVTDENGDYIDTDYDIDITFFDKDVQEFYEGLTEENGLACIHKTYGAGRNG